MSTIITRNSANSGSQPSSLVQGELAINVTDNRLFFGSGSGNTVKEFGVTASYATNALSASYAETASYALTSVTPSLQQVVNVGNSLVNFGGLGTASLLSVNFVNNRSLYLNDDSYPTIRLVDNNNASNNLQIDIDTISLDGVPYNWSDIVNSTASYALQALSASYAETASYAPDYLPLTGGTISGNLYQLGTFYPDQIDWFSSSIGYNTGSYILTTTINGLTTYANYQDVANTLAPYIPTVSSSISASYAGTASYAPAYLPLTGGTINGNVTINGTASIAFLNVTYESASVIYSSGSNQFGDALNDVQTLWGTVDVKTGPVLVTGSLKVSGGITGSLLGTASYATQALSSSYAATASNILGGKATHVPYFITDTTLATSSIYQSGSSTVIINQDNATTANPEALYVFQPSTSSFNVISGKGNLNNYLQLNIQNTNQGTNASSDVVATADNGNESTNYIDMGINSENYSQNFVGAANDAYLYSTGNDLHIGNTTPNKVLQIFAGGSDVDIHNKLVISPNNQHQMTGSLDVSGSIKAFSFTGSLQGNATSATTSQTSSYSTTLGASLSQPANNQVRLLNSAGGTLSTVTVNNVTSASHADNASTADYATTAGNGGVTQLIAGSGVTLIPSTGLGNVTIAATGIGGVTIISGSNVTQSFSNSSTWTFNHNLQTRVPIISVFDTSYNQIIPQNIELTSTSSATITFPTAESGFAVASLGGATGYVLSSSYALLAEYANTASYYPESDPVYIAQKPTLATTGSNVFRGTQIVTGSLFTTGSNTLIGSTTLTGSLNITGSTIQTGNNTLIGLTTLTGSIFINGDIIPEVSSSFDLGSLTNPWRSIYVQSGSISIQSDTPGGIPAVISNANGNVTFAGAGFQLKSGSFVPFEISSSARTIIRVPDIPANDVGGLSIIGSSTGVYQSVTNAGGLLHLTSNDGQSSRITSDAYGINSVVAYVGRKARGTAASPLPVQSGDTLTRISTIGWTGPEYGFLMSASLTIASTAIETVALENFTTSSFGTRHTFYNAPLGGTIRTLSAQIDTTGITIPSSSRFFGTASWAENALTASYVRPLKQDVVITGSLTLSSGSALSINNGFYVDGNRQFNYGQFSSTTTQSGSADTAYSMTFDTTDFSQGISLVSGSRLTIANTGLYNIQYSTQLHTTANQAVDFSIWFAMTGSNIANSNTDFTIEKIAGGGYMAAALNFLTRIQSGSYVELKYSKTTAQGQLLAQGTRSTPTRPATPSVIVTVTQIA